MSLSILRPGSILRASRLVIAAGLAAAWLEAANAPSRAAAIDGAAAPKHVVWPILQAQAPAAAPAQNVEARLAQLHQQLQIAPAQEPRFAAFADVMRENARMMPPAPPANPSAVDDLRLAIQGSEEELGALNRLLPPLQALYASLSPAQQKIADQVFRQGPGE
jgi:periplasmic protein CpxP/Spy